MTKKVGKRVSPRHQFPFDEVPTVRGSIYGGSVVVHYPDSYEAILDCVYEMAEDIASANNSSYGDAINQVLVDERWRLIPKHRTMILNALERN